MTREEILAMEPGIELDSLIAVKVMGWKLVNVGHCEECTVDRGSEIDYFEPSSYISAAWEVVEKTQTTYWVRMNSMMKDHFCGVGKPDMRWEYYGNSMPESICKAALLAVLEATP